MNFFILQHNSLEILYVYIIYTVDILTPQV